MQKTIKLSKQQEEEEQKKKNHTQKNNNKESYSTVNYETLVTMPWAVKHQLQNCELQKTGYSTVNYKALVTELLIDLVIGTFLYRLASGKYLEV